MKKLLLKIPFISRMIRETASEYLSIATEWANHASLHDKESEMYKFSTHEANRFYNMAAKELGYKDIDDMMQYSRK